MLRQFWSDLPILGKIAIAMVVVAIVWDLGLIVWALVA